MSETSAPSNQRDAKRIFLEALEQPEQARAAFVESSCAGDAALRAQVESLLRAYEMAGGFLVGPTLGRTSAIDPAERVPQQIGPYKLLQVIGEGGFGTVYMAEQEHPVRRRVALKVIKLGMDTRQVVARFEAERQALAMMDHPNIAKVFDAGATETGRPYFVMELVNGVPMTQYCDANRLTPRQRLELFIPICQAVQHAHQKGVIHRDIKPSNVLVTLHDGKPVPKVIDFGIAKATQARLTEKTLFTEFRQMIGTPEYMSPEQAEMSGLDVDTRSDIYSLGVLLYELLTGTTPFDARELRSKAFAEIQRVIREVDPPRPSTRLSTMKDTLPSVAARRNVEPRKLNTIVRGDLDWIVMKCLEKDRTRRYESASGLAVDVQHYLADEPITARSPSTWYALRKFAHRKKGLMSAVAAVFVVLIAGVCISSLFAVRARRERDAAIAARNIAEAARKSEAEAREYESGTDKFLIDMFESIDPAQARGKPVLVQDIIDRAARRLDAQPPQHRKAEGSLRFFVGRVYAALGLPEQAYSHWQRAADIYLSEWGEDNARTAKVLNDLGIVSLELNQLDEAERALSKSIQISRRVHGSDNVDTMASENALSELLLRRGKLDEADKLLSDLLPRARRVSGADSEDTLTVLSSYAALRTRQGKYTEAERLWRDGLAAARARLGDDHPYTLAFSNNLVDLLRNEGKLTEAEPLQRQALETARRVLGVDHPQTLSIMNNLGLILEARGEFAEAEKLYLDVIEARRRILGEDHPATLTARNNYALLLQSTGRFDQAEAIFRVVISRGTRVNGQEHANTLLWTNNLAWLLIQRGDVAGGEAIYRTLVPRARQILGPKHPMTISFLTRWGHALALQERWTDAEPMLAEAYAGASDLGIANQQGAYAASYGVCLAKLGKNTEALPILLQADDVLRRAPRRDLAAQRRVADVLVLIYEQTGHTEQAALWRQKRDALSQPTSTPTAPTTAP